MSFSKLPQSPFLRTPFSLVLITIVILNVVKLSSGITDHTDPYRHIQVLDREGKYVLEWLVNWEENRVYFNATVQTQGYVGFGLSKKGFMDGADIVIGGVHPNGEPYFRDRHGVGHQPPKLDGKQDWKLHSAWESRNQTFLSFSRLIETCDEAHDLPITEDEITLVWAFGERDNEQEYHYQNRGDFPAYLLDPDLTPREVNEQSYKNITTPRLIKQLGDFKVWNIPRSQVMLPQDTAYMCTFHKAPTNTKQHIVGFRTVFNSDLARRHIHHFILYICSSPDHIEASDMFEKFVGQPAELCYHPPSGAYPIPSQYCLEFRHEWSVGGGNYFFPGHVGLPLSESPNEYYMLQVHYDNPNELPNIQVDFSLELYYTEKLREHDAGLMYIGNFPSPTTIFVPPSETEHAIYGHCASQCTKKWLPEAGINIFGGKIHTHLAGRKGGFLHIQGDKEMAPLVFDNNYNFNYQHFRVLREERKIYPGDMLVSKCVYETTDRNGSVTTGGLAKKHEMCHGYLSYYPYIRNYGLCFSEIKSNVYRNFLNIYNITWSQESRDYIVTSPESNVGLTVWEAGSRINWTIEKRRELQAHQRLLPQVSVCFSLNPNHIIETLDNLGFSHSQSSQRPSLLTEEEVKGSEALSDLNEEIRDPTNEFISLWPKNLVAYPKISRCLKKTN